MTQAAHRHASLPPTLPADLVLEVKAISALSSFISEIDTFKSNHGPSMIHVNNRVPIENSVCVNAY